MVPRNWHDQYTLRWATVPQSVCKLLEVLELIKRAFPTDTECKGTHASVKGGGSSKQLLLSTVRSQRSAAWMQSTAYYASSIEAHIIPTTPWSATSMRRARLLTCPSQGRACSAIHMVEKHCMSRTIAMSKRQQRSQRLRNLTRNSTT